MIVRLSTVEIDNWLCCILALPVVNWNVTVSNITANEMTIHWQNLASLVNDNVPYYVALVNHNNGSQLSSVAIPGSKNLARLFALLAYTSYQVNVVGIDSGGQSHSSSNVTARTDEGGIRLFIIIVMLMKVTTTTTAIMIVILLLLVKILTRRSALKVCFWGAGVFWNLQIC